METTENSKFKGIWIPKEVIEIDGISTTEMLVLSIAVDMGKLTASNAYIGSKINRSATTVSRAVRNLGQSGLLKIAMGTDQGRTLRTCYPNLDMELRCFYVYQHKDNEGDVFYIGKGKAKRAWSRMRSPEWIEAAKNGFEVEILKEDLTSDEAFSMEDYLLKTTTHPKLVNKTTTSPSRNDYPSLSKRPGDIVETTNNNKEDKKENKKTYSKEYIKTEEEINLSDLTEEEYSRYVEDNNLDF